MKKSFIPVLVMCQDCKKLFVLGKGGIVLRGFYLCDACAKVTRKAGAVQHVGSSTKNG